MGIRGESFAIDFSEKMRYIKIGVSSIKKVGSGGSKLPFVGFQPLMDNGDDSIRRDKPFLGILLSARKGACTGEGYPFQP